METRTPRARDRNPRAARAPREEPGPGRPPLFPKRPSPSPGGSPGPSAAEGKPLRREPGEPRPRGGAGARAGRAGSADGRGGGKPAWIGKARSKGRLIRPPGPRRLRPPGRGFRGAPAAPPWRGSRGGGSARPGTRPSSLLHVGVRVSRPRACGEAKGRVRGRQTDPDGDRDARGTPEARRGPGRPELHRRRGSRSRGVSSPQRPQPPRPAPAGRGSHRGRVRRRRRGPPDLSTKLLSSLVKLHKHPVPASSHLRTGFKGEPSP